MEMAGASQQSFEADLKNQFSGSKRVRPGRGIGHDYLRRECFENPGRR